MTRLNPSKRSVSALPFSSTWSSQTADSSLARLPRRTCSSARKATRPRPDALTRPDQRRNTTHSRNRVAGVVGVRAFRRGRPLALARPRLALALSRVWSEGPTDVNAAGPVGRSRLLLVGRELRNSSRPSTATPATAGPLRTDTAADRRQPAETDTRAADTLKSPPTRSRTRPPSLVRRADP